MRSGGNGFCGCSRVALLNILQDRGRELGVQLRFQREVQGLEELADSDLIVVADGINSIIRSEIQGAFPAQRGSAAEQVHLARLDQADRRVQVFLPRDARGRAARPRLPVRARPLHLGDRDGRGAPGATSASTGIPRATCCRCSSACSPRSSPAIRCIANRSLWRNFPNITNKTWVKHEGNTSAVLIGDAKATAHFSIGSGTKLAMEDAIALFEAFKRASRSEAGFDAVRHRAARRGREDPARRQRLARVVRAPEALLGHGAAAVRLRRNVALQADHLGEPRAARPRVRARSPQVVCRKSKAIKASTSR